MQFFVAFAENLVSSSHANSSFTVRTGDLHNAIPLRIYAIIVVHIMLFIKITTSNIQKSVILLQIWCKKRKKEKR
jgi:uncharacterized membrane protein